MKLDGSGDHLMDSAISENWGMLKMSGWRRDYAASEENSQPADAYALIAMLEYPHLPRGDAHQRCLSYEVQEDSIELPEALTSRYKVVREQSKNTDDAV